MSENLGNEDEGINTETPKKLDQDTRAVIRVGDIEYVGPASRVSVLVWDVDDEGNLTRTARMAVPLNPDLQLAIIGHYLSYMYMTIKAARMKEGHEDVLMEDRSEMMFRLMGEVVHYVGSIKGCTCEKCAGIHNGPDCPCGACSVKKQLIDG